MYARWIVANGLGEMLGLGTTFVLGGALAPSLARVSGVADTLGTAVAAIALGVVLEGVVVGWAQARVLRDWAGVSVGAWIRATAAGAGLAWTLGMVPSTMLSLTAAASPPTDGTPPFEPGPGLTLVLAAGLGLVTGPILGGAQGRVLRQARPDVRGWPWANALAWAFGMPVIFAGMDRVPWNGPLPARVAALYLVCLAAGLVVGAVHGAVLRRQLTRGGA